MNQLENGTVIDTIRRKKATVTRYLGNAGAQHLYAVDYDGQTAVLKWYQHTGYNPKELYGLLQQKVEVGPPSSEFIWPVDISGWNDRSFGYITRQLPQGYHDLYEYICRKASFASYRIRIDAAMNIVAAFHALHSELYAFHDPDGNIFWNAETGEVLIGDTDSIAPCGVNTNLLRLPHFAASEVVFDNKAPCVNSDQYYLSVILFALLCGAHPLEGKRALVPCPTLEIQKKLYWSDALFIMDPDNNENAPDQRIHRNLIVDWQALPEYMRALFQKAFSQNAIHNPHDRIKESEWLHALARFRDDVVICHCGSEVVIRDYRNCVCDNCSERINIPFRVELQQYSIPCVKGTRLYRCQLGVCALEDALRPVGLIVSKKKDPATLGIRNLSNQWWNATELSGNQKDVRPGSIVRLSDGLQILVGSNLFTIRSNLCENTNCSE